MNMAPNSSSSLSSPSSSSSKSSLSPTSLPPHHPPPFTPIPECEREENDDEDEEFDQRTKRDVEIESKHHPTPLHHRSEKRTKQTGRRRPESDSGVSCNECLPSNRDKFSVVPLDNNGVSPNGSRFKSILFSLTKKSPRTSTSSSPAVIDREDQWKIAVTELSHKLIHATKKRDDAVLEASRLKHSVTDLEKKLNKLELYCHDLKSGLEVCSFQNQTPRLSIHSQSTHTKVIEHFLVCVSESRSSVRLLSRSLTLQLRPLGPGPTKILDRISLLLQPYEIKPSLSKNSRALSVYLEALLNRAFFEDFESIGLEKSSVTRILNPISRSESNLASFYQLQGLTWDEVLNKGTKHFSEEFSRFCDRKMSEIVAMLGWNRAWPEPLLQAFFGASKSVWLVHLLANSVHPGLPVFRVDKGVGFDPVYMEDMGGDRATKLGPGAVRIMVAPGFYVYGNVVKCKVLCRYQSNCGDKNGGGGGGGGGGEKGLKLNPSPPI